MNGAFFISTNPQVDSDVEMADAWLLDLEIFPYINLPIELQDLIMKACINVTIASLERLSRLACVSRRWQRTVKSILWSKLGNFQETSTTYWPSSFRGIHLAAFEQYVVGTRRDILRAIELDLDLDEEGQPELAAWPMLPAPFVQFKRERRHNIRFQQYMDALFFALSKFPSNGHGGHISLRVRVHGPKRDMRTRQRLRAPRQAKNAAFPLDPNYRGPFNHAPIFTPTNTVVDYFELIVNPDVRFPYLMSRAMGANDVHYLAEHTVHKFLACCINVTRITHFVDMMPERPYMLELFDRDVMGQRIGAAETALWRLSTAISWPAWTELELKHARRQTEGSHDHYITRPVPLQLIINLASHRLTRLTLDNVVHPLEFLEFVAAQDHEKPALWPKLRHLRINGIVPLAFIQSPDWVDEEQGERLLTHLGLLVQRMPAVETVHVQVEIYLQHWWEGVDANIQFAFVPEDRNEHYKLTIKSSSCRLTLDPGSSKVWMRAAKVTRGLPLKVEVTCDCVPPTGCVVCREPPRGTEAPN